MNSEKTENDRTESLECLAADLAKSLDLPDSLLPIVSEAIEKKATAEGITHSKAYLAIFARAVWWKGFWWKGCGRPIDAKWFQTARYNAWPRPNRYGQHNRLTLQREKQLSMKTPRRRRS